MKNLEQLITDAWYKKKKWILLLYPLEVFYKILYFFRKLFYKLNLFKSEHPQIPVIIVGNISVGGTGKTPVVISLVNYLTKKGWKPGVLSRGYGGNEINHPIKIDDKTNVDDCGDEPLLIFRNSQVPVVVDKVRVRGAKFLREQGCNIIVTDDGLQHLALKRDYELVVVDGMRGFGNNHLLPVGPLRESLTRLDSCDFVLINGQNTDLNFNTPYDNFLIEANELIDTTTLKSYPVSWLKNKEVHALAGIGNPPRFFSLLNKLGATIVEHPFPDHHDYKMSDIPNDKKSLIVTEKDAVKLEKFDLQDCFYLKINTELPLDFLASIDGFLEKSILNKKVSL